MKILVNATITRTGGGVQKAVEFVRASTTQGAGHRFLYVLHEVVARNLERVVELDLSQSLVVSSSPSHPLRGRATRRILREAERRFAPDVVYTVFGPTYMGFRAPHLMGFAVPWITHANRDAWRTLHDPFQRVRFWAWCRYVAYWTRYADRWLVETEVAADGLSRALALPRDRFHVVPNVHGGVYDSGVMNGPLPGTEKTGSTDFNILVFSHWYPHKNLEILPRVASELLDRDPGRRYRFFLTFDTSLPAWKRIRADARRLGVEENVINLGPVLVGDGPRLYGSSDILFLPTLLETYTATYPEAMACHRPIVTTNLPFAHELCGEAALYAAPDDASEAARRIIDLASSPALREELVRKGVERLARAKSREAVYEMTLQALEKTAEGRN